MSIALSNLYLWKGLQIESLTMLSLIMRRRCDLRYYRKRTAASGQCSQWSNGNTKIDRDKAYGAATPSFQRYNPILGSWHTPSIAKMRFYPSPRPQRACQPSSTVPTVQLEASTQKSAPYRKYGVLVKASETSIFLIRQTTRNAESLSLAIIPKAP